MKSWFLKLVVLLAVATPLTGAQAAPAVKAGAADSREVAPSARAQPDETRANDEPDRRQALSYADRAAKASPEVKNFKGGDTAVYIGGSTLLIVLVVVLIVLLI